MLRNQTPSKGKLSNSWWRCTRAIFDEGRPLPPHALLLAEPTSRGSTPFGVIAKTLIPNSDRHRLIYWAPLPKNVPEPTADHPQRITDHITLELWNGTSHPTWCAFNGKSRSPDESRGWKLTPIEEQGVSYWFTMMVELSVLDEQGFEVEANVTAPGSELPVRIAEFKKHVEPSQVAPVAFPPLPQVGNYACCSFFVVTEREKLTEIGKLVLFIEGLPIWRNVTVPAGSELSNVTMTSSVVVDGTEVIIITACPGGAIQESAFAVSTVRKM